MSVARTLWLLLLVSACATPPPATVSVAPTTTTPAPTAPAAATEPVGWQCREALVPPAGYLQETAFVDGTDTQGAVDRARAQMLARLCTASTGSCDGLAELVATWKTGNDVARVCAMVVVQQSAFATWKARQGLDGFDVALQAAVASVLSGLKSPVVAFDSIVDGGVAGGERAVWLQARLAAALSARGVRMIEVPSTFAGVGLPKGATVLLGARTVTRHENNERKLEISLQARVKEGAIVTRRVGPPVVVLASAAPPLTTELPALPVDDAIVTLRLQPLGSTTGHALCTGDKVQLTLTSSARRHVRVIDLYGDGATAGAVLLFPNDERVNDIVTANETIALGGDGGFEAVPLPGTDVERFVVIAATTPAGLGAFAAATTTCRLSPALTKQLHAGTVPGGVDVTSDGFRVLPPAKCTDRPSPSPQTVSALMSSLAALPVCP